MYIGIKLGHERPKAVPHHVGCSEMPGWAQEIYISLLDDAALSYPPMKLVAVRGRVMRRRIKK